MFKNKKSDLDEMQEQKLLKIEHNGCWLAFWGLFAAIVVQMVIGGADFSRVGGEWIVFMVLCVYIMVDCLRSGIWDRRMKPDGRTNLIASLIAGAAVAAIIFLTTWLKYEKPAGSLAAAAIGGVISFAACFVCLSLAARAVKKKQRELEAEPEDE